MDKEPFQQRELPTRTGTKTSCYLILAAVFLSACAAPPKKPSLQPWPEYQATDVVGLVIGPPVTPIKVLAGNGDVALLELAAEKKRKEASMGVGATALTILTAPLAILAPLYPPAIQLAALPFMAADATAKAGQDADRLQQEAAKARLDASCSEQLVAAHPEMAERFQRALIGESLRQAIQAEVRGGLQVRIHASIVPIDAGRDEGRQPDPFLKEAEDRHLPTVVEIQIQSLEVRGEATGNDSGSCRYKIVTSTDLFWWNTGARLIVFIAPSLAHDARLSLEAVDLAALVDRPEELRLVIARGFRDAVVTTLNGPTLKFPQSKAD
jgi:hypothetical protein